MSSTNCVPSANRRRRSALLVAALAVSLLTASPRAHEIGTTQVAAFFAGDARYEIQIVTDAVALVEKLNAVGGESPSGGSDPARLQAEMQALDSRFRRRVVLTFDGLPVTPDISYSVAPAGAASAPVATVRLTGAVPPGARAMRWSYGWTFASYAMTVRSDPSGPPVTQWLEGGETTDEIVLVIPAPHSGRLGTAARYAALGFTHIVPGGLDHVLFVLGLYLLGRQLRPVLWQVSAFTVAHSITLGLSMLGVLAAPPSIVEPLIALSIAYVAVENLFVTGLSSRRIALVFAFGLLHGMGFAGALQELGLPRAEFLTALIGFNAGVEAGQIAVLAAAFLAAGLPWGGRAWYHRRIVVPASALIACVAIYWTVERLVSSAAFTRTIAFIVGWSAQM
jgi:hypothetical protein